jgi:hypothetical protein
VRFTDRWGTMVRRQKPATGVCAAGAIILLFWLTIRRQYA